MLVPSPDAPGRLRLSYPPHPPRLGTVPAPRATVSICALHPVCSLLLRGFGCFSPSSCIISFNLLLNHSQGVFSFPHSSLSRSVSFASVCFLLTPAKWRRAPWAPSLGLFSCLLGSLGLKCPPMLMTLRVNSSRPGLPTKFSKGTCSSQLGIARSVLAGVLPTAARPPTSLSLPCVGEPYCHSSQDPGQTWPESAAGFLSCCHISHPVPCPSRQLCLCTRPRT